MWNEPTPKWRTARKQYQCQGDGCAKVIASGEQYLDRALNQPAHSHLRYCKECAEPVGEGAADDHFLSRSDLPDRYAQRISSTEWKSLRREIIEQRGNRCEQCGHEGGSLVLHHLHDKSMAMSSRKTSSCCVRLAMSRPMRSAWRRGRGVYCRVMTDRVDPRTRPTTELEMGGRCILRSACA